MKANRQMKWSQRWRRADRNFAVATIAHMFFFLAAGFGAWMFGNSGKAAVNPPSPHSSAR